ncbi:MAG TPA: hypothetical protein VJN72_09465 [Gaiellales bacterium]|nr:hypothetical protein [Gaiellales bacterium]
MFAASLLVVAVMATYASLAVISLTAGGSLPVPSSLLSGSLSNSLDIHWNAPSAKDVLGVQSPSSSGSQKVAFLDSPYVSFGQVPTAGAPPAQISVTNTSSAALPLALSVNAPGISASFAPSGLTHMTVHPHQAARITLTSDPRFAGPIEGSLVVSISESGSQPLIIPLSGAQAPLPATGLTATPAAHGAVDLAWTPSASSGVTSYLVQRFAGTTGAWQTIATLSPNATSAVDQTGTDGSFTYQVVAQADSTTNAPLPGPASSTTTVAAVATAPDVISEVTPHPFINFDDVQNGASVGVPVALKPAATAADTITVTLTDTNGTSVSGSTHPGNAATVIVPVSGAGKLADGPIKVSATSSDSLGNTSGPTPGPNIVKDTSLPNVLTVTVPPITGANVGDVPVTVTTDTPGNTIKITMTDPAGNVAQGSDTETPNSSSITIPVDATNLADTPNPDEGITVSVTAIDAAGNASNPATAITGKDTIGPPEPTDIGVAAGPNNPAGVVTAQSASAVMVQVTFAQPPTTDDQMVVWIAGQSQQVPADGQTSSFMVGPFNLTGLADGQYNVGIKQTDGDGNITRTWKHFTVDTGGAESPTSVGVPAGPDNPAGYVNAATQTAATIVATFAGPTDPADQISLSVGGITLPAQSGGSDQLSWTADLSSLADGTIPITGTIVDGNGVSSTFSGSLIKDTAPPPAPAVAYVVGPPANTINQNDASCVKVFVAFNQAPDPNDLVTVSLSDGSTTATGSASAGDGHVVVGCIDASSLSAGSISVNVTVTDVAGNSTDMTGTPATLVPCQPSGQGQGQDGNQGE